ncbi:MAG: 3-phosphoshikimate 1-carboxyvinyltransferase [Egibacteraceae bacterium]
MTVTVIPATAVEVSPSGPVHARLRAPASKSVTNRLLVIAALAEGSSLLRGPLDSDDTRAMRRAVLALGAQVSDAPEGWRVTGTGGRPHPAPGAVVDARLSGTTLRFVTAMATLADGPVTVTGARALLRRPVGALVAALRALGADAADAGGLPPVRLGGGGLRGGPVEVDVTGSSQFSTAVLLIAPYAREGVLVTAAGAAAGGYLDLTVTMMRRWGATVAQVNDVCWDVAPTARYAARDEAVEYDASAAAHLFALAAATGGAVTVVNAAAGTLQPDAGLPAVLERMGATVARDGDALTVSGPARLEPVEVDLRAMPDQVTTVAALAALAEGTSRLHGLAVARGHETDRLAALAGELRKLGVPVSEAPDGLEITGGAARGPAQLATHDDHRLAMAFAAIGARVPGVVIEEPWCVTKTYPGFWEDLRAAGVSWELAG